MQSILVSGARKVRSVSGCLVRGGLVSKPRWCKFLGEAAKETRPAMVNLTEPWGRAFEVDDDDDDDDDDWRSFLRDNLGYYSWDGSGLKLEPPCPYSEDEAEEYDKEAEKALSREAEEESEYLLTIKSEEEMRMVFNRWAAAYGRVYDSDEEREFRFGIFAENLKRINEHNSRRSQNRGEHLAGLNLFGDRMFCEIATGGPDIPEEESWGPRPRLFDRA